MTWKVAELVHNYEKSDKIDKTIAGLELLPDLVEGVKHLVLQFGAGKPLPQNEGVIELPGEKIAADVNILYNLRSLSFDGVFRSRKAGDSTGVFKKEGVFHQHGHEAFFDKLHLPQLEHFAVKNSDVIELDHFLTMIVKHRNTLKFVELIRVTLTPGVECKHQNQAGWIRLLEAAKCLRADATMTITAPRVLKYISKKDRKELNQKDGWYSDKVEVCFNSVDDGKDVKSIRILAEKFQGHLGLHYFSQPGHLHKSLEHLKRNYKELLTSKEVKDAGATYKKLFVGEEQPRKQYIASQAEVTVSRGRGRLDDGTSSHEQTAQAGAQRPCRHDVFNSTATPIWAPDGSLLGAPSPAEYQQPLLPRPYTALGQAVKDTFRIQHDEQKKNRAQNPARRRSLKDHAFPQQAGEYKFNRDELRLMVFEDDSLLRFGSKKAFRKG